MVGEWKNGPIPAPGFYWIREGGKSTIVEADESVVWSFGQSMSEGIMAHFEYWSERIEAPDGSAV